MAKNSSYEPRLYREAMGNKRWKSFRVSYRETDLWVAVDADSYRPGTERYTMDRILFYRGVLEEHIKDCPEFLSSLSPLAGPAGVHPMVREMYVASWAAGAGPMSAVAGAMAEYICWNLMKRFSLQEVVIENGGDIFMILTAPVTLAVYAGTSPLSEKIGLVIDPGQTPMSVCTSSGTVGHSLSFGVADACMIACRSGARADAWATAFCNEVKKKDMVQEVTEVAMQKTDIMSVVIIAGEKVGIGGSIEVKVLKAG